MEQLHPSIIKTSNYNENNSIFTIAIGGSSDTGIEKMNPLAIRTYDDSCGIVHTQFLDMCMSSDATVEGIFSIMQEALDKHEIPWNIVLVLVLTTPQSIWGATTPLEQELQKRIQLCMF